MFVEEEEEEEVSTEDNMYPTTVTITNEWGVVMGIGNKSSSFFSSGSSRAISMTCTIVTSASTIGVNLKV